MWGGGGEAVFPLRPHVGHIPGKRNSAIYYIGDGDDCCHITVVILFNCWTKAPLPTCISPGITENDSTLPSAQ